MMTITVNEIETTITNYINLGTEILTYISETDEMLKHAKNMEFEKAAELRDKIKELENML